tara:strand:- start:176 stop:304 length:129 start_codon:yes stop_codon:yes gene_type:complete
MLFKDFFFKIYYYFASERIIRIIGFLFQKIILGGGWIALGDT